MPVNGSDFVESVGSFDDFNELKNHYRQNDVITIVLSVRQGMILSDARDNRAYHCKVAGDGVNPGTFNELLQAEKVVCHNDEVVCHNDEIVTN